MRWQQNTTELRHVVGSGPTSYLGSGISTVISYHISEVSKFLFLLKKSEGQWQLAHITTAFFTQIPICY